MVWYQMESLSNFLKLYGSVPTELEANKEYTLVIKPNFKAESIGSKKYIYLTELGIFGGKNLFLPFILMGAGGMIFIVMIVFFGCYFKKLHKKNRDTEAFLLTLKY